MKITFTTIHTAVGRAHFTLNREYDVVAFRMDEYGDYEFFARGEDGFMLKITCEDDNDYGFFILGHS